MGDHFKIMMNRLITESTLHDLIESRNQLKDECAMLDDTQDIELIVMDGSATGKLVQCRICHDEDIDSNMDTPCSCSGSLKYAHPRCVQKWCNEKGDTLCEICHQQYKPGYVAPPPLLLTGNIPLNLRRHRVLSRTGLNGRHMYGNGTDSDDSDLSDSDYTGSSSRSLRCLVVATIFFLLLGLRHILPIFIQGSGFCLALLMFALLRIIGLALLIYVVKLAVTGCQCGWHRRILVVHDVSPVPSGEEEEEWQNSHVIEIPSSED